jgi:hypothetical protein
MSQGQPQTNGKTAWTYLVGGLLVVLFTWCISLQAQTSAASAKSDAATTDIAEIREALSEIRGDVKQILREMPREGGP